MPIPPAPPEFSSALPPTAATTGVPYSANMSTPRWRRPPDLESPQVSLNVVAPATGQTKPSPPRTRGAGCEPPSDPSDPPEPSDAPDTSDPPDPPAPPRLPPRPPPPHRPPFPRRPRPGRGPGPPPLTPLRKLPPPQPRPPPH